MERLYWEENDGKVRLEWDGKVQAMKMVTVIEIGSLYLEKRGEAVRLASLLSQF